MILLIICIGILVTAAYGIKNKIGNLRPAILPPARTNEEPTSPLPSQLSDIINARISQPISYLTAPQGFQIGNFAKNLGGARDLQFSPGGTLLVSLPDQGKIVALPDKNQDGASDSSLEVLTRLNRPHGLAFYESFLFVAELTQVVRYKWDESNLTATKDKILFALPYSGGHNTRSLVFNNKGQLFVSLGSSCNVCQEKNDRLAGVIISDKDGNNPRVWAKGLRNSVFLTVNPSSDEVWAADMGRDYLGDNLPPEEINIIRDGANYGWPICYGNKIHDDKFDTNQYIRDPCEDSVSPIFEFPAHSAPLGLTFINSPQFLTDWQGDLLVAYHGSWNRSTPAGYKVVRMKVAGNTITCAEDFITGFGQALARPVDLIFDSQGNLYISDDKAGVVYKLIKTP